MPNYVYRAKTKEGEAVSGTEYFENERQLAESLRSRGLSLISVVSAAARKKKMIWGRVSVVDKLMFTRNLRVMINAGMPITRVLEILAGQARSRKFAAVILEVNEKLKKGIGLAEAFSGRPEIFDEFYVSMVKSGESGSNLESVLAAIEEQLRRDYELRSKIKAALIYPIVILSALVGVGGMIVFFVMPQLAKAFAGMGAKTPFTLRIFMWFNDFLAKNWWLTFLFFLVLGALIFLFLRYPGFKKTRAWLVLNSPIFGSISRQLNAARFLRTFSSLAAGGVPIYQALNITADTLNNYFFNRSLKKATIEVQRGKSIHESLDKKFWPPLVVEMITVGEETGRLADISRQLAFFYEEEVANTVKNIASLIEPILMIVIGVAIGIFAVSVIQPIYSIVGTF